MKKQHLSPAEEVRFKGLMDEAYKKVFNLAYRLSGNRADAEDLTQEAFYRAYRAFPTYEGDRPFENWIYRIVTRLFLDMKRRHKRRVQTVSYDNPLRPDSVDDSVMFDAADGKPNPEEVLVGMHLSEPMEQCLDVLSEDQRKLVLLADIDGVSYQDLAEMLQAPVGTIRSRLHRAHKQLRQVWERMGLPAVEA